VGASGPERGSFRDRHAAIFYADGQVLRGLGPAAKADWDRLVRSRFFGRALEAGTIVRTEVVDGPVDAGEWAAVLRHERVPFVSYPYEWTFGMLQDAALLHLALLAEALDDGFVLKDGSAYNVQWRGARPVFIDVPSFTTAAAGDDLWPGYRQFCQMFLFPLMLQAYRDVPFQPWLRGSLEGIDAVHAAHLLRGRDLLRRGVLRHVWLHARLQDRAAGSDRRLRDELRQAGAGASIVRATARSLERAVHAARWRPRASAWTSYASDNSYDEAMREQKLAFVRRVLEARSRALVWDLGCNTGQFARLAARDARYVVAMDGDQASVEVLYRALKVEGVGRILPLLVDLADPSPNRGWRGRERLGLLERGRPDLVLCLALVHHLVIAANVPPEEVLDWLADLGAEVVLEYVGKDDAMVRRLLRNKDDQYASYDAEPFARAVEARFEVAARSPVGGGTRVLYHLRPRA
jgi:SAM-dependent methyltransferase